MVKINKSIEIVSSSINALSSMSHRSREAVRAVLAEHYTDVRISVVNNLTDLKAVCARRPDLVFLGMKYVPINPALGEHDPIRVWVADYLDDHDIAYTGSNQPAHEAELNKHFAKQKVLDNGLKTSPFCVIAHDQADSYHNVLLEYPVFIKPTNRGGGLGIDSDSVANNIEQLSAKVRGLSVKLQADSLIEEYLPGREFSVAILKKQHYDQFFVMPIEIIAPEDENGARLLSALVKKSDTETTKAVIDKELKSKISTLALKVFHTLGARDYGRIDIRLDKAGAAHFLEANLIPSLLNGYGNFPKSCLLNDGIDFEAMILSITKLGFAHHSVFLSDEDLGNNISALRFPQSTLLPAKA